MQNKLNKHFTQYV